MNYSTIDTRYYDRATGAQKLFSDRLNLFGESNAGVKASALRCINNFDDLINYP